MSSFPSELWSTVFALACTDGGATGCALSTVSHYFRAVVLPLQLDNVALVSPTKMLSFLAMLQKRDRELRCVKHLYLAGSAEWRMGSEAFGHTITRAPGFMKRVNMILTMLAPELVTLTTVLPEMGTLSHTILGIHFPKLRELTVHGHLVNPSSVAGEVEQQSSFPSLTHLHILTSPDSASLYATRAPALTHLRLSSVATIHESIFQDLLLILDGFDPDEEQTPSEPSERPTIPPTVQKIIIQPHRGHSRFNYSERFGRGSVLWDLRKRDKHNKLVILWPRYQSGQVGPVQEPSEREMWTERILGGIGCWTEGSQESFSSPKDLRGLMGAMEI